MHTINLILTYLYSHKAALLALMGGGAGLSVALQVVLHKLHIDSKKVAYTLIHLFALAAAAADYILQLSGNKVSALPVYAGLVIAAQTVHRFAVDPIYTNKVLPFLEFEAGVKKVAANPADATPLTEAAATAATADPFQ